MPPTRYLVLGMGPLSHANFSCRKGARLWDNPQEKKRSPVLRVALDSFKGLESRFRRFYSATPWLALAMALLVLSTAWATALSTSEPLNTASKAVCKSVRSWGSWESRGPAVMELTLEFRS